MRNSEIIYAGFLSDAEVSAMEEHEAEMAEIHAYIHAEFCGQLNFLKISANSEKGGRELVN